MVEDLLERRKRVLGSHFPLFYEQPIRMVRGEGVWLYAHDGRRFLDVYNNVPHVGHCHPQVVSALCEQAATLNVHTRYLHDKVIDYAERLTATFDPALAAATLTCTGTEANELALRIARFITGNRGIIVTDFSYHGNSATLAETTTGLMHPEPIAPHVRIIHVPDMLFEHAGEDPDAVARRYADEVAAAVRSLDEEGFGTAALLVDTLFSSEGLPSVPTGFLEHCVGHVRRAGGLFIADEVQPGFGRLGDHMWGHQYYDVVPDIVTLGKPMGNGHPVAGVVMRKDYIEQFGAHAHYFNTFGGNPVSAAVGMAVLDVLKDEQLEENARRVGTYVQQALRDLADRHPLITEVRGRGFFFGATLRRDGKPAANEAMMIVNRMRDEGVLMSRIGPHDNVLKMRPPMVFKEEHADVLIGTLDRVLTSL